MNEPIQVPDGYVLIESVDLHSNLNLRFQQGVESGVIIGDSRARGLAVLLAFLGLMVGMLIGAWLA